MEYRAAIAVPRLKALNMIGRIKARIKPRPNLPAHLFWDTIVENIDWSKSFRFVIGRVLDRGSDEEIAEMVRYYGREKVVKAITTEHVMIYNFRIDEVAEYFGLKKEHLFVYRWRQKRQYFFI